MGAVVTLSPLTKSALVGRDTRNSRRGRRSNGRSTSQKIICVGSVTPVTTVVSVVVPFRNGTVIKGPIWPGLLTLVNTISPLLLVSGAAAGIESKPGRRRGVVRDRMRQLRWSVRKNWTIQG